MYLQSKYEGRCATNANIIEIEFMIVPCPKGTRRGLGHDFRLQSLAVTGNHQSRIRSPGDDN